MLRLNINTISIQIQKVLESEKRKMSDEIIHLIADLADGSVRDALSILDKVLELENPVEIKQILGIIDKKIIFTLCEKIAEGDVGGIYSTISDLYAGSQDLGLFCHDILMHFREILIVKTTENSADILQKTVDDIEELKKSAVNFATEHILYAMKVLEQTLQLLPRSIDKRANIEMCMLKIASPSLNNDYESLLTRISKIENILKKNDIKSFSANIKNNNIKPDKNIDSVDLQKAIEPKQIQDEEQYKTEILIKKQKEEIEENIDLSSSSVYKELVSWKDITDEIRKADRRLSLTLSKCCDALYKDKEILIVCQKQSDLPMLKDPKNIEIITRALEDDRKIGYTIKTALGNKTDYLKKEKDTITYENIEGNELFKF
jgi:DNA polymerase-3 subunit gamma/tau